MGTSAGAMNAAVIAYGLTIGGNEGARTKLAEFWRAISESAQFSPLQPSWLDRSQNPGSLDHSPGYLFMDMLSRVFSPYELNPLNHDPLRELGESSKLNANWDFLMYLHELGRERRDAFLHAHYDKLGRESSTPIAGRFL